MRSAVVQSPTNRRANRVTERVSQQTNSTVLSPPAYGIELADQPTRTQTSTTVQTSPQLSAVATPQLVSEPIPIAEIPAPMAETLPLSQDSTITEIAAVAAPAVAPIELLIPEPPTDLSDTDQQQLQSVGRRASAETQTQETLPSASENTSTARHAVTEPVAETAARANAGLAAALGEQPQPSPEIEALCQRILQAIRDRRPPDEDSLLETNPREEAEAAGGMLQSSVESGVQGVENNYQQLNDSPQGTPQQQAQSISSPTAVTPQGLGASGAVPEAVPTENVSLEADVAASATRIQDAGMDSAPAQLVQSGPVAEARSAQGELTETAQRDPAEVLAEQQATRDNARSDMVALQQQALAALQENRSQTIGGLDSQQVGMVESEQQTRTRISGEAQTIFDNAQTLVNAQLAPLTRTATQRWESGVDVLSTQFENDLARIQRWIDDRHSGVSGAIVGVWDSVTGLPGWVTTAYNRAERNFGDGICRLLREISTEVNGVIAICERIIDNANTRIATLFSNLPANLQEWANGEQARFSEQLNSLHDRVTSTRDDFNRDLSERASQSVQEVRERIHELRQAAGGLVGRIADAIAKFAEDPARFILNGLLELVGIASASFWALVDRIGSVVNDIADDPLGFANNLASALGQGFQQFFDNFRTHIVGGFFDWLFSGLGTVGVQLPSDFSPASLITFFLQLMGITWANIREILARHIGEENVALIEQAYELISTLIEQGPEGIFEMIKEQLNPSAMLTAVMDAAIDFMIEALISAVTPRIIAMFNPAGAIIQAIEVIYRILAWVFNNAARIFSLVETVVNGAAELIAGNFTGMATAIEAALAGIIAPVIDFLAGFLGLGNLPESIADTIRGFQQMVLGVVERVVAWLAQRARGLLQALGIGGEDNEESSGDGIDIFTINETFTEEDGDRHSIKLEQRSNRVALVIRSDPKTFEELIRERTNELDSQNNEDIPKLSALTEAQRLKNEMDGKVTEYKDNLASRNSSIRISRETAQVIANKITQIKIQLSIAGIDQDVAELVPTQVTHNVSSNRAMHVLAKPLTRLAGNTHGSTPSQDPVGWDDIPENNKSNWVRAHLLNHQLHGPGIAWNLVPGTKETNNNMKTEIETPAKIAVINSDNKKYYYEANVSYFRGVFPREYYKNFPRVIDIRWGELIEDNGNFREGPNLGKRFTQDPPVFTQVTAAAINESSASRLHEASKGEAGSPIPKAVFQKLVSVRRDLTGHRFSSREELKTKMNAQYKKDGRGDNYFSEHYETKLFILLNEDIIFLDFP